VSRAVTPDPWTDLRALTRARIALGRAGGSLPTVELLGFSAAHAAARDAVWSALDLDALAAAVAPAGLPVVRVRSRAVDRATYLQRPDLGRRLDPAGEAALGAARAGGAGGEAAGCDVALVLADGLSATAAQLHGPSLVLALVPRLRARGLRPGPLVLAAQARVALEDPIGAALGARAAIIFLGERPGLGVADSLGAYLVFGPRPGRTDAERNCVSSIRPDGLPVPAAAELLDWLVSEALRRSLSGVELKDERGVIAAAPVAARLAE
jgi:ethanolamine ammonia-lyase small subunit